jgi:opacity protein-like surface antigen
MITIVVLAPVVLSATLAVDPVNNSPMPEAPEPFAVFEPAPLFEPAALSGGGGYLRLNGGLVSTRSSDGPDEDVDFNQGYLLGLAIGQRMSSGDQPLNFDLELEAVWTDQDADDDGVLQAVTDVTTIGGFLNGTIDFRLAGRLSLYAAAGIGATWMDVGTESDSLHDFQDEDGPFLSWQAKAGLAWSMSDSMSLLFGYRFIDVDDNQIDDDVGSSDFELSTEQHVLELGLRFGF